MLQLEKFKFHTRKKNVCLDGGAAWEQVTERWEFCILGAVWLLKGAAGLC